MAGGLPVVPTGYEVLDQQTQQKRALAQAMLEAGLGPHEPYRSPFQVLGQLAQVWAGKSLQKDANKMQSEVLAKKMADFQTARQSLSADVAGGATPEQIYTKYGTDPLLQDAIKPIVEAYGEGLKRTATNSADIVKDQQYRGDPMEMKGPDGTFVTGSFDKTGNNFAVTPGGFALPPKIENINGVAVDLQHQPSGKLLPADPTAVANHAGAPNSNFTPNSAVQDFEIAKAGAGAAKYNAQFINTGETEYGKRIGGSLGEADAAAIAAARQAPQQYQNAQRVLDLLRKNPITGTAADARLALNKALATLGIHGSARADATQLLAAQLASGTLQNIKSSGLGSGNGFTDKDREFLQQASSGQISMTPGALARLAQLNQRSAIQSRQAGRRVISRMAGNPATANLVQGFAAELDTPLEGESRGRPPANETTAQRAQRILQQRRGGAGGSPRTFP